MSSYMTGLLPTIQRKRPGIETQLLILDGPSVNFARNECAHYAVKEGFRELFFIDDDMGWTEAHFERMISHEYLDVVGGLYCKRRPGPPQWFVNTIPDQNPDKDGLCEVNDIATGFMKIRVDTVLREFMETYPEREFWHRPEENGHKTTAFEFFPMGVVGSRSPDLKLEKIQATLVQPVTAETRLEMIQKILSDKGEVGTLRGEDYYFCYLVRKMGYKIFADFGMPIVPHIGDVPYPITQDKVGIKTEANSG